MPLSSLDTRIYQALTACHCMKEKFLRCESCEVAILDESLASGIKIIFAEVRESPLVETVRNTLTFEILLTNASHHLTNIEVWALRACCHHCFKAVGHGQFSDSIIACIFTSLAQLAIDHELKAVLNAQMWLSIKMSCLSTVGNLLNDLHILF